MPEVRLTPEMNAYLDTLRAENIHKQIQDRKRYRRILALEFMNIVEIPSQLNVINNLKAKYAEVCREIDKLQTEISRLDPNMNVYVNMVERHEIENLPGL